METLISYLATPNGLELTHAVAVLLIAVSAWLTYQTHKRTKAVEQQLNGHIEHHVIDAVMAERESHSPTEPELSSESPIAPPPPQRPPS